MQYRTISNGTTSFEVSTLCLGTMFFGTRTDTATSLEILDRFAEAGGTFVDTANNYNAWVGGHGRDSEDVLGEWIRRRGGLGDVRLATKLGAAKKDPALPLQTVEPTNYQGLSAEVVAREARLSLQHLGIDRIDVLYGHVDDRKTPLAETVGAFGQLQREGLVGISGISNVALWRLVEAREEALRQGVAPYGVVQQGYSYVYPSPAAGRTNDVSADLLDYVESLAAGAVRFPGRGRAGRARARERMGERMLRGARRSPSRRTRPCTRVRSRATTSRCGRRCATRRTASVCGCCTTSPPRSARRRTRSRSRGCWAAPCR